MHDGNRWSWEGIQLMWVVLGFIGASLGIASMPQMTKKQLWAALLAGVVCAALAPGLIAELWSWYKSYPTTMPLPMPIANTLAFFFGIGGMFIVPGALVFWATARNNPMYIVDWLRGKVPAPTPANPYDPTDPLNPNNKEPK